MTAEEVKNLREKMGLSMEDFAREIGTTTSTVFRWEKGIQSPGRMAQKLLGMLKEKADKETVGA